MPDLIVVQTQPLINVVVTPQVPIKVEVRAAVVVNIAGGEINDFKILVTQSMLSGSLYMFTHPLDTVDVDLTVTDSIGEISIDWKAINPSFIRLDFQGLIPLTETYRVTVRK